MSMSPFCSDHPNGTDQACRPCGTARLHYSQARRNAESALVELAEARFAHTDDRLTEMPDRVGKKLPAQVLSCAKRLGRRLGGVFRRDRRFDGVKVVVSTRFSHDARVCDGCVRARAIQAARGGDAA